MIRTSLFLAATALCVAPAALAEHDRYGSYNSYSGGQPTVASVACERQQNNDRLAGGLVGAVAGGLIGAAIGGELEPDNGFHRARGYRGYRGHRGYRSRRGYYHDRGDDGAEIAGALIGGVLGAAVGSEIAGDSTNCAQTYSYSGRQDYGRQTGYGDPYAPTRSPTGPAWENPEYQQSAGPAQVRNVSSTAPAYPSTPAYPSAPAYPAEPVDDLYGAPEASPTSDACTRVNRETRLPDGTIIREPVDVCQTEDGRWQMPQLAADE